MTDEEIEALACAEADRAWSQVILPYCHCSECPHDAPLRRCVCNVMDRPALCAQHWVLKRIAEMKAAEMKAAEPKEPFPVAELKYGGLIPLDVDDFVRL